MAEEDQKKKQVLLAILGVSLVLVGYNQIKKAFPQAPFYWSNLHVLSCWLFA